MTARLTYWDGRGNAEIIRLMLIVTGEPWTEKVYGADEAHVQSFDHVKVMLDDGVLAFDQLPLLQIDGLNLVQKNAIVRYLARKHNMYGSTPAEAVQIDIVAEGILDWKSTMSSRDFGKTAKYLPRLERVLLSNGGGAGYLVGDRISFVDVQLFEILEFAKERELDFSAYPVLLAYHARLASLPSLSAYLSSDKRYPFPGREGYFDRVKASIPWVFGEGAEPAMASTVWKFHAE